MAISVGLHAKARSIQGVEGWPFRAVADAMEVIPRTLVQNSGGNAIRVLTELRVRFFFLSLTLIRIANVIDRPSTRMANTLGVSTVTPARLSI